MSVPVREKRRRHACTGQGVPLLSSPIITWPRVSPLLSSSLPCHNEAKRGPGGSVPSNLLLSSEPKRSRVLLLLFFFPPPPIRRNKAYSPPPDFRILILFSEKLKSEGHFRERLSQKPSSR